jgi:hypothetical protein
MKDKLLKMIKAKEDMKAQRKAEIKKDIENAKDSTEIRSLYTQLNKEIDSMDGEIKEYRDMVTEIEKTEKRNEPDDNDPNIASKVSGGAEPQKEALTQQSKSHKKKLRCT